MRTGGPIGAPIRLYRAAELIERTAERIRAMTQWKEGDYFELRCRGRVAAAGTGADQTRMCLHLWGDEHSTLDYGRAVYAPESWFDEHATKLERPLEFGQRVTTFDAPLTFRVLEELGDKVRVWPEGLANTNVYQRSELTLTDDQD